MNYLLLTTAILSCMFGCNKSCPDKSAQPKSSAAVHQTIRVNNPGSLPSVHPHTGISLHCRIIEKALFEGLMRVNPDGQSELATAESIAVSPDLKTYTFTLRSTNWTNGEPVTAYQFEKAWKSALDPSSTCLRSDLFYAIKNAKAAKTGEVGLDAVGVHALDASTLVVELEHPTPYFLDLIANPLFSPLFDENPVPAVFNGPFYIAKLEHDKKMILQKNHAYWDAAHVALDAIDVSFIADPSTALMLYEKGELDWAGHPFTKLPQDALPDLERKSDFHQKQLDAVYWLCLNTQTPSLASSKIRTALSMALNRDDLASHVLLGETPTRSLIPTALALLESQELYPDSNPNAARALFDEGLAELGLSRETFPPLIFSYSDVAGQKQLAEAIQQSWSHTFDIPVKLHGSEWNVFFASLGERQFQVGGCVWFSAYHDASYNLEFFKDKQHRYNSPQWENVHYQELLRLADNETDPAIRREHLRQAEMLLLTEMPVIPLFVANAKYLKSPHVHGITVSDDGQIDFKWASLD